MGPRLEFLPADATPRSELALRAAAGGLKLEGLPLARSLTEIPARPAAGFEELEREPLARWLETRLAELRPHVAVIEAARSLAVEGAGCVLATVRPGPFAGPLRGLWKTLRCVRLAEQLAARHGRPVVPLIWIDADDAGLRDLHPAWLLNHHAEVQHVGFADLRPAARPFSELTLDAERQGLGAVRAHLAQLHGDFAHLEEALELCMPRDGESLARAYERAWLSLFGAHGLIVVEPDWLRDELAQGLARVIGADASAHLEQEAIPLVDRVNGTLRRPLRSQAGGLRFDDEPGSRTHAELAAEIIQEPRAWSAGAALLPLVQDRILPVIARIGDDDELELAALRTSLRAALELPAPAFVLHSPVTLVDGDCERALQRLDATPLEILRHGGMPPRVAESDSPPELEVVARVRRIAERAAEGLLGERREIARLDPAFALHLKRAAKSLRSSIGKLCARAEHLDATRGGALRRHARRATATLAPHGSLQERRLGPFAFIARHGTGWIDELTRSTEAFGEEAFGGEVFGAEHLLVRLDEPERSE